MRRFLVITSLVLAASLPLFAASILFDASHHEMAGNADWVVDADAWNLSMTAYSTPTCKTTSEANPQRYPTPAQSGITPTTAETYWTGAISSWGIELAKAGHAIETLPNGGLITYGDNTNPQDLSHYQLFIVVEPQTPFTSAEKSAILAFVNAGGGLFMVGDHETSDRDCDGWESPKIWNDLMGATSTTSTGIFGIWMRELGSQSSGTEDWFDDGTDNNVSTDPADPIIHGPFGDGSGGLGLFGATSMDIDTTKATAHVWRTGQTHDNLRVTFATATYGMGRVAAIGDSSPADDGTGDPGDTLYGGWDKAVGGVNNREIHLNACAWLLNPPADTTPPQILSGPAATHSDCSAVISWTTDEPATSSVDYGLTASYGSGASAAGYADSHEVILLGLSPSTTYHYRASSTDAAGNGPTLSTDATFTTSAAAPPVITSGPSAGNIAGASAAISWSTDEAATSQVEYGLTTSYGENASVAGYATAHSVTLSGLSPETSYHYRVLSADGCGNGPSASADAVFTTGAASLDISGWVLKQHNSELSYTFPQGTTIPSGGYAVVARDSGRAQFESFFPAMPAATVFLNSNATGSCTNGCFPQINGGESFELWNAASTQVDGTTITITTGNAYQRTSPGAAAPNASSWNTVAMANANPGGGAGAMTGAGVVINEMSDASDYTKEFIELYYDAGSAPADTIAPAPISDLTALPLSDTSIKLAWTATGDDGGTGTAAAYDIRMSASRITDESSFASAAPLSSPPTPSIAGTPQQFTVTGLAADTPYYFAMKVRDEVPNWSGLSNYASAVTAPSGGGGPAPVSHLVISQIQVAGDGAAASDDEFVELYNPTASAVPIAGWSLQYKSATGTTFAKLNIPAGSIQSHGYYLVARSAYNGSPAYDLLNGVFLMAGAGGNLYLVNNQTLLTSCASSSIVDKAAYGTGNCPETAAASAPAANNSILRKPGGAQGSGTDSDDNSVDFLGLAPSVPHNSSSTPATPPAGSVLGHVGPTLYLTAGASESELSWANAANATSYNVYRGTAPDFMTAGPVPWKSTAANSSADASAPAAVYYYVVRCTDGLTEND